MSRFRDESLRLKRWISKNGKSLIPSRTRDFPLPTSSQPESSHPRVRDRTGAQQAPSSAVVPKDHVASTAREESDKVQLTNSVSTAHQTISKKSDNKKSAPRSEAKTPSSNPFLTKDSEQGVLSILEDSSSSPTSSAPSSHVEEQHESEGSRLTSLKREQPWQTHTDSQFGAEVESRVEHESDSIISDDGLLDINASGPVRGLLPGPNDSVKAQPPFLPAGRSSSAAPMSQRSRELRVDHEGGTDGDEVKLRMSVRSPTVDIVANDADAAVPNPALEDKSSRNLHPNYAKRPSIVNQPSSTPLNLLKRKGLPNIFPQEIPVEVRLTFNENTHIWEKKEFPNFRWFDATEYKRLDTEFSVKKCKEANSDMKHHTTYFRHGSCDIEGPSGLYYESKYSILDDDDFDQSVAQKAIVNICGFIHDHSMEDFRLVVHLDYSSAQLEPLSNVKFAANIKREIGNKMQMNFLKQQYISRCDLARFADLPVITQLVLQDRPLDESGHALNDKAAKDFAETIFFRSTPASKLLLLCIFIEKDMEFFQHLFRYHKFHDRNLPTGKPCDRFDCEGRISELMKYIPAFFVGFVSYDFRDRELKDDDVMPIRYKTGSDLDKLGSGAHGDVYRVTIDPGHHYISGNPQSDFAMKVFPGRQNHRDAFIREKTMLNELANNPHPHIVPHITTWFHRNNFYILYPIAAHNLRGFMQKTVPQGLGENEVLWFFKQLQGLSKALKQVHNYDRPTVVKGNLTTEQWGCHHDIKPENILVFEKQPGTHPHFKIGDFGSGSFNPAKGVGGVSESTEAIGTKTYFAPERQWTKSVSRPYDMWGLGCVFLELLTWFFKKFHEGDSGAFSTARLHYTGADSRNSNDTFWVQTGPIEEKEKAFRLLPIVEETISGLESIECRKITAFKRLLTAIRGLFIINPKERWKAEKLAAELDLIVKIVVKRVHADRLYYQRRYEHNLGLHLRGGSSLSGNSKTGASTEMSKRSRSLSRGRNIGVHLIPGANNGEGPSAANDVIYVGSKPSQILTTESKPGENTGSLLDTIDTLSTYPMGKELNNLIPVEPPQEGAGKGKEKALH